MSEKREDTCQEEDKLWDKTFTDNEDLDSTGHLSRTEWRKQEAHSSTITTVLVVLIIILAATPLVYWISNKQSFNHPVQTKEVASVSSKKQTSRRVAVSHRQNRSSRQQQLSASSREVTNSSVRNSRQSSQLTASNSQNNRSGQRYLVAQRGDSLARIAARNGLTLQELARLNNMTVNTPIHPGQRLRVR